jgi:hypothetical protein
LQLLRYVPDGSLCTASAEQIFPRDSVQRNCFELALYVTRDHDCISHSVQLFETARDADVASWVRSQRRRVIDRAIIMLNDHRFWGHTILIFGAVATAGGICYFALFYRFMRGGTAT